MVDRTSADNAKSSWRQDVSRASQPICALGRSRMSFIRCADLTHPRVSSPAETAVSPLHSRRQDAVAPVPKTGKASSSTPARPRKPSESRAERTIQIVARSAMARKVQGGGEEAYLISRSEE